MSKVTQGSAASAGPAVIRFEAILVEQSSPAKTGPRTFLHVPPAISKQLRGMNSLEGTINGQPFRAALEPDASGGLWLQVNKAMCKGAGAGVGDTVQLAVLGPEPEPRIPDDLRSAFAASKEARVVWDELTHLGRLDWIRWIDGAKKPETRARRVQRTVDQLAEGKRRACCVNVYEYMLCRIEETETAVPKRRQS